MNKLFYRPDQAADILEISKRTLAKGNLPISSILTYNKSYYAH